MAKKLFGLEKGVRIHHGSDDSRFVDILMGSAAPGLDTETNEALMGSLYQRESGEAWLKISAGSGADKWIRIATVNDLVALSWRSEKVVAATGQAAPVSGSTIDLDAVPFSDDEGTTLGGADFTVGDHVIFGVGGTPKLMKVSVIAGDVVTFVDADNALADNDMLIVRHYLPDTPADQEAQAIVHYNGTNIIKVADFNWSIATGINLSSGYAAIAGDVSPNDSVETAIAKLDGVQDNIRQALGLSQSQSDMGTYLGNIIPDNADQKGVNQSLETAIEDINKSLIKDAVTTKQTVDSLLVDNILAAEWKVVVTLDSAPARRKYMRIFAIHNGHAAADANNIDFSIADKLNLGINFSVTPDVELSGSGATQSMNLTFLAPAGVSIRATRTKVEALGI